MAFFSLEHPSEGRFLPLVSLRARVIASWKRYRAERALEGLPYDTLKDIGFPSAERMNDTTTAR